MNQRSIDIINDMLKNHLPRIIEGLEKGYIDENQVLVVYDRLVRARTLNDFYGAEVNPAEAAALSGLIKIGKERQGIETRKDGMRPIDVVCSGCKQVIHGFETRVGEKVFTSGFKRMGRDLEVVMCDECIMPTCVREGLALTEQKGEPVPLPAQPAAPPPRNVIPGLKRIVFKFVLDGEEREWPRDIITAGELLDMMPEPKSQYAIFMETPGDQPDSKVEGSNPGHPYFLRENSITKRFFTVPAATFGESSRPIVGGDNSEAAPFCCPECNKETGVCPVHFGRGDC